LDALDDGPYGISMHEAFRQFAESLR
jgi:hypothetical protein